MDTDTAMDTAAATVVATSFTLLLPFLLPFLLLSPSLFRFQFPPLPPSTAERCMVARCLVSPVAKDVARCMEAAEIKRIWTLLV